METKTMRSAASTRVTRVLFATPSLPTACFSCIRVILLDPVGILHRVIRLRCCVNLTKCEGHVRIVPAYPTCRKDCSSAS